MVESTNVKMFKCLPTVREEKTGRNTYNTGSFSVCTGVRGRWIWLFERTVIGRRRLQQENTRRYMTVTFIQTTSTPRTENTSLYLSVFVPLSQVLLCWRVWSFGRSPVDRVLQTVGLLFGAAGSTGLHAATERCGDGAAGWRRGRLCFNWSLFTERKGQIVRLVNLPQKGTGFPNLNHLCHSSWETHVNQWRG